MVQGYAPADRGTGASSAGPDFVPGWKGSDFGKVNLAASFAKVGDPGEVDMTVSDVPQVHHVDVPLMETQIASLQSALLNMKAELNSTQAMALQTATAQRHAEMRALQMQAEVQSEAHECALVVGAAHNLKDELGHVVLDLARAEEGL